MKRIAIAAMTMVTGLVLSMAGHAQAETVAPMASCSALAAEDPYGGFGTAVDMDAPPARVVWGKRLQAAFWKDDWDDQIAVSGRQIAFEAADASRPISRPFVRDLPGPGSFAKPGGVPFGLAEGDGAGKLTYRWVESHLVPTDTEEGWGELNCAAEQSWVIEGMDGRYPRIRRISGLAEDYGHGSNQVLTLVYNRTDLCQSREDRAVAADGVLELTVRGFGRRGRVSILSPCRPYPLDKFATTRHWAAQVEHGNFAIRPRSPRTGRGRMHFRITFGGRPIYKGTFVFQTKIRHTRRIWAGSNEFIDRCVYGYPQIYLTPGGRLYCDVGGKTRRTLRNYRGRNLPR